MSEALDCLVSEKVMGWTVRESDQDDNDYERYTNGWAVSRWNPSTSIAAAWEVVEHLRKQTKDDGTRKHLVSMIDHSSVWECLIEQTGDDENIKRVSESPCMAICLAALRAMNVDEATIQEACK